MTLARLLGISGVIIPLLACNDDRGTGIRRPRASKTQAQDQTAKGDREAADADGESGDADDEDGSQPIGGENEEAPVVCVPKTAKSNEEGVGAYCNATIKCKTGVCSGDFGARDGESFCTKGCSTDADCGAGAYCFTDTRGRGCVVEACQPRE